MIQRILSALIWTTLCGGTALLMVVFVIHLWGVFSGGLDLFSWVWAPVNQEYGLGVPVVGTILTVCGSVISMAPFATMAALFLGGLELPKWVRFSIDFLLEVAASIPSVLYGVWAIWYLVPRMNMMASLPFVYKGFFPALCVLSVMILPYMVGTIYYFYRQVPKMMIRQGYILGGSLADVLREIVVPYIGRSFFSVIFIAMMKVLAETMIVLMVIGHAFDRSELWVSGASSLSSLLAMDWVNRVSPDHYHVLVIVAGLLIVISCACQYASRHFCAPQFTLPAVKGGL